MSTFRRVQYALKLQYSPDTGKSCSASGGERQKGYPPTLICVGSSGHPRPHFSANAEKNPALLASKHQICRYSSPTLICVGRTATFQR